MKLPAWLCATLVATVCVSQGGEAQAPSPGALSAEQNTAVQGAVKSRLSDPDSARFGGYALATRPTGIRLVCGWVNAKNRFGGYTGNRPYMVMLIGTDGASLIDVGGTDATAEAILGQCAEEGVRLPD